MRVKSGKAQIVMLCDIVQPRLLVRASLATCLAMVNNPGPASDIVVAQITGLLRMILNRYGGAAADVPEEKVEDLARMSVNENLSDADFHEALDTLRQVAEHNKELHEQDERARAVGAGAGAGPRGDLQAAELALRVVGKAIALRNAAGYHVAASVAARDAAGAPRRAALVTALLREKAYDSRYLNLKHACRKLGLPVKGLGVAELERQLQEYVHRA